MVLERNVGVLT